MRIHTTNKLDSMRKFEDEKRRKKVILSPLICDQCENTNKI